MNQRIVSFIFYVRGVIWAFTLGGAILLKHFLGGSTSMSLFITGSVIVALMEIFRIYTAGYLRGKQPVAKIQAQYLCSSGPFAYLRNPLYVANMIRGIGVCIAINEWYAYALFIVINAWVFSIIIPYEEKFLEETFGEDYRQYQAATRRFIPRQRPYQTDTTVIPSYRASLLTELHTILFLGFLLAMTYIWFLK
ncbi:MAG: isoprenylcysteine carboxylmethyltransferase family protein [Fidelibacterota bacterium]|nr:MAG: isoprenylcysteine carboxylmethyltransferase family protein [Candidatus Neomarinimicrobiota bacterium]